MSSPPSTRTGCCLVAVLLALALLSGCSAPTAPPDNPGDEIVVENVDTERHDVSIRVVKDETVVLTRNYTLQPTAELTVSVPVNGPYRLEASAGDVPTQTVTVRRHRGVLDPRVMVDEDATFRVFQQEVLVDPQR